MQFEDPNKHFKLIESDSVVSDTGETLYRIQATKDSKHVKAETLGGYVANLESLRGNAWVSGNARVSGDARVLGDAWEVSPLYVQGSKHSLVMCTRNKLKIGCQTHSIPEWLDNFETVGRNNQYTDEQIAEYKLYIDLFAARYLNK